MKDSKEKEHRISNLKEMIDNIDAEISDSDIEGIEEDIELINYINEGHVDNGDYEINDEFIYRPGDEDVNAINLEADDINEDFLIKTPKEKEIENDDASENEEFVDDFSAGRREGFDKVINAKIGRTAV